MNTQQHEYAGFWVRFYACLIDTVAITMVLLVSLAFVYGYQYWKGDAHVNAYWNVFFSYVLPAIVTIWFWFRFGATPGKMLLKLKIVDAETGSNLSFGQTIGRYFAYILAMLLLGLGIIWVGIDKKKQGWHDKLAGTIVIKNNPSESARFAE